MAVVQCRTGWYEYWNIHEIHVFFGGLNDVVWHRGMGVLLEPGSHPTDTA